jgi:hypothetical protein
MADQPTRPSRETREEEERDAKVAAGPDKSGSEQLSADDAKADKDVAAHEKEMAERGAEQKGEGRLP